MRHQSPNHSGAFFRSRTEAWAALLRLLHDTSASGISTLLICSEARRPQLLRHLRDNGIGFANPDPSTCFEVRSWEELNHGESPSWPNAIPGLIGSALAESQAAGFRPIRAWSDMESLPVGSSDRRVVASYERQLSELASQYDCELILAYTMVGWNSATLIEMMSIHPMVLIGLRSQPNPYFRHAQEWESRSETVRELLHRHRVVFARSVLSATRRRHDWAGIIDSMASGLASMVNAEFVGTTSLGGGAESFRLAFARSNVWTRDDVTDALRSVVSAVSSDRPAGGTVLAANLADAGELRILLVPLGLSGNSVLVVGSVDQEFPTASQREVLLLGANLATMSIQRSRAEEGEYRFSKLVENSPDLIGIASLEGVPQYINPAGLQLLGLDDLDQGGQASILDFIAPEDRARARDEYWPIMEKTGRWRGEIRLKNFRADATVPFLVDWFRIDDRRTGRPSAMATVSRDLTAQKQAEAELRHFNATLQQQVASRTQALAAVNSDLQKTLAEQKLAHARLQELQSELFHAGRLSAMGQTAGTLAHELGQPLSAIINYINAARRLLMGKGEERTELALANMNDAAEAVLRAGRILQRLRDFVAGGEPEWHAEDVSDLIEEAESLALVGSTGSAIQVYRQVAPGLPLVFVDRTQIQQVLFNLIRNAIDAMTDGVRRELILTASQSNGNFVEISVTDSGSGISDNLAGRLFQPFVTTKPHGTGLGLSICRSIIEAHGGRLWYEPRAGGGASFLFTVPAANANNDGR